MKKLQVHICTDWPSQSYVHLKMCDLLISSTRTSKTKWNTERNSSYRFSCERSYIASDLNCVGRKCDVAQAPGLCSTEHSLCHHRKMKSAFTYQWSQSFFTSLPKTCSRLSYKTKRWWKEQKLCSDAKARRRQRRKGNHYIDTTYFLLPLLIFFICSSECPCAYVERLMAQSPRVLAEAIYSL